MKKQMRDENLMKISELADRSVTDSSVANVLLCYMLYRVKVPLESELLYDIAVTGGIINYQGSKVDFGKFSLRPAIWVDPAN